MKKNIHPKYYKSARVRCACGNTFTVGATKEFIETEICSKCHPFYTGQARIVDTLGRVQKYKKRLAKKRELETMKKKGKKSASSADTVRRRKKTKKEKQS